MPARVPKHSAPGRRRATPSWLWLWLWLAGALAASVAAARAETLRVGTPEPTAFSFSILTAGIDGGFFAQQGLAVERLDFGGGGKMHQAMAAGAIDIAVGTGSDLLFVIRGAPEKGVAAAGSTPVSLSILARADGAIATPADLRGKTIATTTAGSMTSWIAMEVSRREGWGPDGMKRAYVGSYNGAVAALMAHDVDGIVGTTAGGYVLAAEGKARFIVKPGDVIKDFIAQMIYASDSLMQQRPDALRRFLRGWFATVRAMKQDKVLALRLTRTVTNLPPDIAGKVYDEEMPTYPSDGHFEARKFAAVKQSLIDLGLVATMPPDATLITEQFLP